MTAPANAQSPVFVTPDLGLSLTQGDMPVPMANFGAHYTAILDAAPFDLQTLGTQNGSALMLAIGPDPTIFDRVGDAQNPVFGSGSAYARYPVPGAALYLSDPACLLGAQSGFNVLYKEHAENDVWPITQIEVDRGSDNCATATMPTDTNLIRPGQRLYLVADHGDGPEFLVLEFRLTPSS